MIPLPPKIDASVTMMQVEEKPDVTYSDVGGCKEQIEKLREVVETPLLNVSTSLFLLELNLLTISNSLKSL
jgi:ATP-dependent 26S proteasome regulatory subunit